MPGIGPAPAENRRRRNVPARGDWVELEPVTDPVLPELPEDTEWSQRTRDTWEMWRYDPATTQYTSGDVAFALDTIRLYEGMTRPGASEVRMRMTDLGLTPEGKKKLRYRVTEAEGTPVTPTKRRSRSHGRRNRLSVVK